MNNQLRIIAGQWKRRQLDFASIEGLRPTPDRLRETLFNWLMWEIQGAYVLDLCTGSGALSFESLSRGAAHVTMVEPHKQQVSYLKKNIALLNIDHVTLMPMTAQQALATFDVDSRFDLVFLDPPYALKLWNELAQLVDPFLRENGMIYIETDQSLNNLQLPSDWQLIKQTKVGKIFAGLWQKKKS